MKPEAQDIALAVLTRVKERAGSVNKTRLLKLLYLADIEHYRKFGVTLTGFDWKFYLFGPWAAEYDTLLAELERTDAIALESWTTADRDGARISLRAEHELDKVIPDTGVIRVRRAILRHMEFSVSLVCLDHSGHRRKDHGCQHRQRQQAQRNRDNTSL